MKKNALKLAMVLSVVLENDSLYTLHELAAFLKTSYNSLNVRRHLGTFTIPCVRDGHRLLFKGSSVLEWVKQNTDPTGGVVPQSPRPRSPGRPRKNKRLAA